ncbi:xanthine dehydrogenase family protein molybdopterin-binding subunit [Oceanibacterium hippocampi]|uniref:Isoquinoline 1-oxidoreductase subunit beta n=1 Tax=Oceanibacterium hippocampi TaxID=745714 RepID=A0A1Y5T8R2_9PROT|nr:xanthine dehydrogenase family protein molybdopterin-binding subunit [Oceanibacterium hippocampi]SLN57937.1 Isoquinoline 1-oxidoreductase subunit beta [Oceanibacterium hippocampi]
MNRPFQTSRRRFLIGAAAGGGLIVGYQLLGRPAGAETFLDMTVAGEAPLNAWVRIAADGTVTVAVPRAEMGQGVYTGLAMLVAEELEADWASVRVEQAPIDGVYGNIEILVDGLPFLPEDDGMVAGSVRWMTRKVAGMLGLQATGGSTTLRDGWEGMRHAGAAAREMLISAGAGKLGVGRGECRAEKGRVVHPASGRSVGYGEVAEAARRVELSEEPRLKTPEQWTLIGTSPARVDIPAKVDGSAEFGIDIRRPDMLHAAIATSPVFGGTLKSYDATKAKAMSGVVKVVEAAGGVAVIADNTWRARQALDAVAIEWDSGENGTVTSESIFARFARDHDEGDIDTHRDDGDVEEALAGAATVVEAEYRVPYLAHACMEPMNCTALVDDHRAEIWTGNQAPPLMRMAAAEAADLDGDDVTVHTPFLGGGFGRRSETDLAFQATAIARQVPGRPVKLTWSREDDMRHDMYRPAALSRFRIGLDAAGAPVAWSNRIVSQSVVANFMGRLMPGAPMLLKDKTTAEGAFDRPYEFANQRVEHVVSETHVPVGFWRSVGHSLNAFCVESAMDEAAHAAKADPVAFRLALLKNHPRAARVLQTAADAAGWGTPLPAGRGRGVALHRSFGSTVAEIAEVTVRGDGTLKVDRVVCAVDCGRAVQPDGVVAQMESGIVYGMTAAFYGAIDIVDGAVAQGNFPDYEMLRLADMPVVETHIVESGEPLGGVGEPGTPPIAAALANAIFAATGNRIRTLPLQKAGFAPAGVA